MGKKEVSKKLELSKGLITPDTKELPLPLIMCHRKPMPEKPSVMKSLVTIASALSHHLTRGLFSAKS